MSGVFDEVVEYGPGGYDTIKPNNNVISTQQVEVPVRDANERSIRDKAKLALTANGDFLALGSPTNAQILAQIRLLTRECNGVIRLLLAELQDVSDT